MDYNDSNKVSVDMVKSRNNGLLQVALLPHRQVCSSLCYLISQLLYYTWIPTRINHPTDKSWIQLLGQRH